MRLRNTTLWLLVSAASFGCGDALDDDDRSSRARALLGGGQGPAGGAVPRLDVEAPALAAAAPGRRSTGSTSTGDGHATVTDEELAAAGDPSACADLKPMTAAESLALEFPWGKGDGAGWDGTGHPDPKEIAEIPTEELLGRALSTRPEHRNDRLTALVSLGRRRVPVAMSALQTGLASDDVFVRQIALSGLVEHGGGAALGLMWQAMGDREPQIRGNAIWAVALYGKSEAMKAIQRGLKDPDPGVQGMAILATTALAEPELMYPILAESAASDEQRIYQEAAYVLSHMDEKKAQLILAKAFRGTKDRLKRQTYAFYLRQSRKRNGDLCN